MTRAIEMFQTIWNHPANSANRWAGLGRYARWQLNKRVVRRPIEFPYHGFVLPGYLDSHSMSAAYYFAGLSDWWEMRFICDYLREGDLFLDVGANVGLYSLLAAARVGGSGHVDAFEPADIPARRLQEAVDRNDLGKIISVHRFAVTDRNGYVDFGFADDDCQAHVRRIDEHDDSTVKVPAVRLDEHCAGRSYAMAKFDIEGHEPLALAGAAQMLAVGNPAVMQIEMAGYSKLFGVPTSELIGWLDDVGYDCTYYDPKTRELRPASRPWELPIDNVLAICRSARCDVESKLADLPR